MSAQFQGLEVLRPFTDDTPTEDAVRTLLTTVKASASPGTEQSYVDSAAGVLIEPNAGKLEELQPYRGWAIIGDVTRPTPNGLPSFLPLDSNIHISPALVPTVFLVSRENCSWSGAGLPLRAGVVSC